ncbi:MAG TPA: four-carbon acid sugar kinase family protein [Anaeromyxobacter sp.]|nr:four-carbon acid sugar kinase family protein [Anaeromyxobacter sp.]
MIQAVVIADDLTGAADCGSAFAAAGLRTFVEAGGGTVPGDVDAISIDVDTRRMAAGAAARLAGAVAERASALGPRILYKKIDSTLRGHVGAELAATLEALRRGGAERPLVILAPAFPAAGRTTRGGGVLVNGAPLEETELWRDARRVGPADLSSVLASGGLRAVLVGLDEIRGGEALARALDRVTGQGMDVAVCDAETERDLGAIAAAGARLESRVVWAGSGGLARHLPAALGLRVPHRAARRELAHDPRPVLALVGSRSGVSRDQARALASAAGVVALALDPEALLAGEGDPRWPAREVAAAISAGRDLLLTLSDRPVPVERGPVLAAVVAGLVAPHLPRCAGVVATGGDVARALLGAVGAHGVHLAAEVEPGVPLGFTDTAPPLRLVTKAGGFGSPGALVKARDAIRGGRG